MDSYKSMVLALILATGIGVGGAFLLTSNDNSAVRYGQQSSWEAPATPSLECAKFRGSFAQGECERLNQHRALPPRERHIYDSATQLLRRMQRENGAAPAPSPQTAFALAQHMGVLQNDASLVYQAMQDNYKRDILANQLIALERGEQMLSELHPSSQQ